MRRDIKCENCQAEIYGGDTRYHWRNKKWLCEDCFILKLAQNLEEVADAMGFDVEVIPKR